MPVTVDTLKDSGSNLYFYGPLTVTSQANLPGRGDTYDVVEFRNEATVPQIAIGRSQLSFYDVLTATTVDVNDPDARFTAKPGSVGTIGTLNLADGLVSLEAPVTITTLNWTGGTLAAGADGVLPASVSIPANSELRLNVAQTTFPAITVGASGLLSGDVTGAVYSGPDQNVAFEEDAILAATAGPVPTRADLGGAIIYGGVPDASSGGPYTAGDDGATTIYKGLALGPWAPNDDIRVELGAVANSGTLHVKVLSTHENYAQAVWRGDGSGTPEGTTADLEMGPLATLILRGDLNQDAIASGEPNLITTFNITRTPGRERTDILRFNGGGIAEGQTVSVSGGRLDNLQNLTGGKLKGTLELASVEVEQPGDDFTAADIGSIHFGDRAVMDLRNLSNLDCYEALGDRLTYSGNPVAYLAHKATYDFSTIGPVLQGFLQNADYVVAGYKVLTLASDAPLGHGHYIFNTYERKNGSGWAAATGAERVVYAQNGPMDGTDWIGIAATGTNQHMDIEIYAPDATLRLGTADPARLFTGLSGAFENTTADQNVTLKRNVTAKGIDVKSGGLSIEGIETTQLLSAGPDVPFVINFDSISTNDPDLSLRSEAIDDTNPVVINMTAGDELKFGGLTREVNDVFDLSNTSISVGPDVRRVNVDFGQGGNWATLLVGDLHLDTEMRIDDGAHVEVNGRFSGTGSTTYRHYVQVNGTGSVAPGAADGGVGTLSPLSLILKEGATYEWELSDAGNDLIDTGHLTLEGDGSITFWTLDVLSDGFTGDLTGQVYKVFEYNGLTSETSGDRITSAQIVSTTGDFETGSAYLTFDGSSIWLNGLLPGATPLVWDNGGSTLKWELAENWNPDQVPDDTTFPTIDNGDTVLLDTGTDIDPEQAKKLQKVQVGQQGTLNVDGTLTADEVVCEGIVSGSGTIAGDLTLDGGTVLPGTSVGTLTVEGNATFGNGATYVAEVQNKGAEDGLGTGDLLAVTGTLDLSGEGDTLAIEWLPGSEASSKFGGEYVLATAAEDQLVGNFDQVAGNIAAYVEEVDIDEGVGTGEAKLAVVIHDLLDGDATMDATVSLADLSVLGTNWLGSDKDWMEGDFTFDGTVSLADLSLLGGNWLQTAGGGGEGAGMTLPATAGVSAVPEPGSLLMLLAAALSVAGLAWRRRKQCAWRCGARQAVKCPKCAKPRCLFEHRGFFLRAGLWGRAICKSEVGSGKWVTLVHRQRSQPHPPTTSDPKTDARDRRCGRVSRLDHEIQHARWRGRETASQRVSVAQREPPAHAGGSPMSASGQFRRKRETLARGGETPVLTKQWHAEYPAGPRAVA